METAWMERTALMVGASGIEKLTQAHVLVMGLGGVGSYAAEALARAGIGTLTIVDGDVVDPTNRNRQLQALSTTHGQSKAQLMHDRLMQINPEITIRSINVFQDPTEVQVLVSKRYTYVVDAIDSISPKLFALKAAFEAGNKIVSSMGAGGKMDPTKVRVVDIAKTNICPLAHQIRKKLREHDIRKGIQAVYSE